MAFAAINRYVTSFVLLNNLYRLTTHCLFDWIPFLGLMAGKPHFTDAGKPHFTDKESHETSYSIAFLCFSFYCRVWMLF